MRLPPPDKEGDQEGEQEEEVQEKEQESQPVQAKGGPSKRTRSRTVQSVKRRKGNGAKPHSP